MSVVTSFISTAVEPKPGSLRDLDLMGCFAADGVVHPDTRPAEGTALLRDFAEALFVPQIEDAHGHGMVATALPSPETPPPMPSIPARHVIPAARPVIPAARPVNRDPESSSTAMLAPLLAERAAQAERNAQSVRSATERFRRGGANGGGTADEEANGLPRIGTVIDKFRIEEELGAGGFATVYRATHLLMRSQVALKVLHPWVIERRPHLVEQLCEEARFTALIDHPNVVRLSDVTSGGRYTYIVMEYIDGVSLGRAIERQPLRPKEAVKLGMHVVAGLQAGLEQGLVHRDIKPGNILITRTGKAKIVDFGLARNLRVDGNSSSLDMLNGEVAGTPAYMAPEQATNFAGADFRADIYSLGATLYHASLGVPPFTEQDPLRLVYAHIHHDPPRPQQLVPNFPERFGDLLMRMLAKRPEHRPASYEALGNELRDIYEVLRRQSEMRRSTELLSKVKGLFSRRETN